MIRILVLCTGNSCRSQMAEGFFRHFASGRVDVFSAGLEPKGVHPLAIKVMAELGIDISKQTSNHVSEFIGHPFDYVITVCDNAAERCPTFPGNTARLHWSFEDPAGATGTEEAVLKVFRRVRTEIESRIRSWLSEIPLRPKS